MLKARLNRYPSCLSDSAVIKLLNIASRYFGVLLLLFCGKASGFSHLVVFGDSLSDGGNLAGIVGLPPPYYNNRISNGPVAVDLVAGQLGLSADYSRHLFSSRGGENYAVGGANAGGNDLQDLSRQLSAFSARHPAGLGPDALYIIMIGGNDIRDARGQVSVVQRTAITSAAVTAIENLVQQLLTRGARNILVANAPDISRIPETLQAAVSDPDVVLRARDATQSFNSSLKQMLDLFPRSNNINLMQFDLYQTVNQILNNPSGFGFSVSTQQCFNPDNFQLVPGCDFRRYVFFDRIHPTSRTHGIIAQRMISMLRSELNPSPAGWIGAIQLLLD